MENYPYTYQAEQALGQAVLQSRQRRVFYHTGWVRSVQWSPDGKRLLTASEDGTVKIWEPSSGKELLSLNHDDRVYYALWSDDGTQVLTDDEENWNIILWDSYSGEKLVVMEGHTDDVLGAYWSPDGSRVLSASEDSTARIWDAKTGELIRSLEHPGAVKRALWSPDGETFVTMGEDAPMIWDASTFEQIITLKGPTKITIDARWSPEGDRLSTNPVGSSAKVWDMRNGELLLDFPILSNSSKSRWSPDGKKILVRDQEYPGPSIYDAVTGEKLLHIEDFENDQIQKAAWSPDGTRFATYTRGTIGNIWDAVSGEKLLQFSGHTAGVWGLFWSPTGERLATGGYDNTVRVWDTTTGDQVLHYPFDRKVDHVDWSPDGGTLLISNSDRLLVLPVWNSAQELIDYAHECCLVRELKPEEREFFGLTSTENK